VVKDKNTKKSLGYGFVKYLRYEDACNAIQLKNGLSIGHKRIKVSVARPPSDDIRNCKLYITNLPKEYTDEEVMSLFSQFGEIIECRVLKDRNLKSNRGVAFVQFALRSQANTALVLNGFRPPGSNRNLSVKYAEDQHKKNERQFKPGGLVGDDYMDMLGPMPQEQPYYHSSFRSQGGIQVQVGQVIQPMGNNMYVQSQANNMYMYSASNDQQRRMRMKDQHQMRSNSGNLMVPISPSNASMSTMNTQWGYSAGMNGMIAYDTSTMQQNSVIGMQHNILASPLQTPAMGYGMQSLSPPQQSQHDGDAYESGPVRSRQVQPVQVQMSPPHYSMGSSMGSSMPPQSMLHVSSPQKKMQFPHGAAGQHAHQGGQRSRQNQMQAGEPSRATGPDTKGIMNGNMSNIPVMDTQKEEATTTTSIAETTGTVPLRVGDQVNSAAASQTQTQDSKETKDAKESVQSKDSKEGSTMSQAAPEHTGSVTIVISNLPSHADVALLHDLIAPYGRILSAQTEVDKRIKADGKRKSSKCNGRGYVQISGMPAAQQAKEALEGSLLSNGGYPLKVKIR
jgi:RNA recognition motif-containing protein